MHFFLKTKQNHRIQPHQFLSERQPLPVKSPIQTTRIWEHRQGEKSIILASRVSLKHYLIHLTGKNLIEPLDVCCCYKKADTTKWPPATQSRDSQQCTEQPARLCSTTLPTA